ncbi:tRNA (5-methylaminomethyl-2-thiouridine)(34)-methyltransferase MnmD [Spirosoma rhododendri]|uniref:tRNA (5-methylaminomethyl-2-thiouridine)(34)-methyltransferase MnmD n=1 Tax=Spirosoma rhododendri TaxID=2728024 RepID=A0A7L5DJM3_9BACT|nr:tRNA (5-methylaminomethyl-2-thiouridine)(34)-methyltransferase MnmD [Spirosoma rhododendri]QJD78305.1 tRNA (5-methylaminomethyl-2-thiouridine)(34)-methyltransferase MnmD [Spirosoma rhododendri]
MSTTIRVAMTADGSHTLVNGDFEKSYHSVYGALQESQRVYIELGLLPAFERFPANPITLFEMGFGSGLNALLTLREAEQHQRPVHYVAIDTDPVPSSETQQLNFDQLLGTHHLDALHEAPWNTVVAITPYFTLEKRQSRLQDFDTDQRFHLVYFDAFSPTSQPELWEADMFGKLAGFLLPGGLLTTYCSKSVVQRAMRTAGLTVEKHSGPHYKRNVLRAVKS